MNYLIEIDWLAILALFRFGFLYKQTEIIFRYQPLSQANVFNFLSLFQSEMYLELKSF